MINNIYCLLIKNKISMKLKKIKQYHNLLCHLNNKLIIHHLIEQIIIQNKKKPHFITLEKVNGNKLQKLIKTNVMNSLNINKRLKIGKFRMKMKEKKYLKFLK